MKKIVIMLFALWATACEETVLGPPEDNDPINNFEIFWRDFDEHYGLFTARGWDWDSIYREYRPRVNDQTTDRELWEVFREMIAYLDDSHTSIYDPAEGREFVSGSEDEEVARRVFDWRVIHDNYLDEVQSASDKIEWAYGKIKDKPIGYIILTDMEGDNPAIIDRILSEIGDFEAIIFDIRQNTGGTDEFSARVASPFADGRHLIYTVQERNGPAHDDFAEKKFYYTEPRGEMTYQKPVIMLTDKITISAADVFLLHMKAFDHVKQIGDSTAGDFSDLSMARFLPNGWTYQYSIMMFLRPDGSSLDGIGHVPDIFVRNTETAIQAGRDLVLDRVIQYLEEEHNIR